MKRMKRQGDTRPMKGSPSAMHELKAILARRQQLYAEAQLTIRTTGKPPYFGGETPDRPQIKEDTQ